MCRSAGEALTTPLNLTARANLTLAFAAVACSALVVAAIWVVPFIPMNDGPQHLFGAWARNHVDDPAAGLAGLVAVNQPVTSNGYALVFRVIEPALGWRDAHRLTLTIVALVWSFGFLLLVMAIEKRRAFIGLLGFASALSWSFYIGLLPFLLGTALGFFITALAIRVSARAHGLRLIDRGALAALLAVQATSHVFPAIVTGLVLVAVSIARAPITRWPREIGALALTGAPAAAIALLSLAGGEATPAEWRWEPFLDRAAAVGVSFVGGPAWRAWPIVAIAALGALSMTAHTPRRPEERGLLAAGLVLVALSFVIPETAGGWQLASTRTLSMGVLACVALVPIEALVGGKQVAARVGVIAVAVSSLAWSIHLHRRVAEQFDDVIDALSAPVRASGLRMPLVLVPDVVDATLPHSEPLRSIGPLFAVAHGGVPTNAFVGVTAVDHLVWTDEEARPPLPSEPYMTGLRAGPDGQDALLAFAIDVGRRYPGGVIVIEPAALHGRWLARGWIADHLDRRVLIAHFEGCSLDTTPPAGATSVETGLWPRRPGGLVRRTSLSGARTLSGLGCGEVWLRFVSADGAPVSCGATEGSGGAVEGEDEAQIVRTRTERGSSASLVCR